MTLKQTIVTDNDFPEGSPDIQQTSLSLDVMGRFYCNTLDEALTNPDFDVVVIGSGMYGGYCAAKIVSESNVPGRRRLRVLVLEAGPFLIHEHGQNIPDLGLGNPFRPGFDTFSGEAQKTHDLVWGIGWRSNVQFPGTAYCVGGKSLFWGGWCPRLRAADLAQWPQAVTDYLTSPPTFGSNLPNRLDPPPRSSIYEAVEYEIGVKPPDDYVFDPINGPDEPAGSLGLNAALDAVLKASLAKLRGTAGSTPLQDPEPPPIAVQTQSFVSGVFSPDKFSSLPLLLAARRNNKGSNDGQSQIFIVPRAHVSRLIVPKVYRDNANRDGYRVSAIDLFVDGARKRIDLKPTCTVVLALGCFESTRLALDSFPTGPSRPGNDEIMGRNLMAHLRFDFTFQIKRDKFAEWVFDTTGKRLRDRLQTAAFHIQADTPDGRFHLQVYAAGINSNPEPNGVDNPEGLLYRMIPDAELAQRLADNQDPGEISVVFRACGELKGDRTQPVKAPGTSWIDLAGFVDRDNLFDHSRAYVNYANPVSQPMWSRMRKACVDLATEMGGRNLAGEDRHEIGTTWHDSGTLFMGDEPQDSVTDVSGHFHHISNAVCVDQSLFPTVGSANPVLTGLCLTRKAAEAIVEREVSVPELTLAEINQEKVDGFEFLLEGTNSAKWTPNNPKFSANGHAPLIENRSILEVHGFEGLGVLYYNDASLFQDFELRVQWKAFLEPGNGDITANSGVFLRGPKPPFDLDDANFYDRAIEVQIDDTGYDFGSRKFGSPLHRTGAIYKFHPARAWLQKRPSFDNSPGAWNEYRIVVRGTNVTVQLNGQIISQGDVPAGLTAAGYIGFQYHSGKVQFRLARIKRL